MPSSDVPVVRGGRVCAPQAAYPRFFASFTWTVLLLLTFTASTRAQATNQTCSLTVVGYDGGACALSCQSSHRYALTVDGVSVRTMSLWVVVSGSIVLSSVNRYPMPPTSFTAPKTAAQCALQYNCYGPGNATCIGSIVVVDEGVPSSKTVEYVVIGVVVGVVVLVCVLFGWMAKRRGKHNAQEEEQGDAEGGGEGAPGEPTPKPRQFVVRGGDGSAGGGGPSPVKGNDVNNTVRAGLGSRSPAAAAVAAAAARSSHGPPSPDDRQSALTRQLVAMPGVVVHASPLSARGKMRLKQSLRGKMATAEGAAAPVDAGDTPTRNPLLRGDAAGATAPPPSQ